MTREEFWDATDSGDFRALYFHGYTTEAHLEGFVWSFSGGALGTNMFFFVRSGWGGAPHTYESVRAVI